MTFEKITKGIEFEKIDPSWVTTIMIKLSGGIDSALTFYMLCRYLEKYPEIKIIPITTNDWKKPYQVNFSSKVIEWMKNEFPKVKILEHETLQLLSGDDYIEGQDKHRMSVREKYLNTDNHIQLIISGMNQNPPLEVTNTFVDKNGSVVGGPTDDRKSIKPQWSEFPQIKIFNPIINLNKKGIADLCKKFNLTETLFPITRSCEGLSPIETNNYTEHCGECWWCHERKWGFGKLV